MRLIVETGSDREVGALYFLVVMPGLDPGIHSVTPANYRRNGMDCRVKPDNDDSP